MPMDDESEMVTLPEAAKELGLTWNTAWNAVLRGRLEGEKEGRGWLVTKASIERYRIVYGP